MPEVNCQQCGTLMRAGKKVDKSYSLQVVGILVFLIGFALLFLFPIGTLFGIVLMIAAARMGYSKKNAWICGNCGYFFERA